MAMLGENTHNITKVTQIDIDLLFVCQHIVGQRQAFRFILHFDHVLFELGAFCGIKVKGKT